MRKAGKISHTSALFRARVITINTAVGIKGTNRKQLSVRMI
jgi:hypothetical protein